MIKNDIGLDAGNVYFLLSQRGRLSLRKIGELTHKRESHIFLSLGWLLRENKINAIEQNGEWLFEVKSVMSEIYY
nr:winged helix-turn-helix domain-containing protein [Parabacteroides sp. PF5-9]